MKGRLYLVGSGLKADLITIRGLNILKEADVVLYDRLIDRKLLDNCNCEKIDVGKHPYSHNRRQSEINLLIEKYLLEDKKVVRLKGGDPSIFSRVSEEIDVAKKLGCPIEVIPGVTAASVAASKILCSLTDRQYSSGTVFITGHRCKENLELLYNWKYLVELKLTIVIYMGVKNMLLIIDKLIENGLPLDTPLLIAEKLETSDEKIILTDLENSKNMFDDIGFPNITIIGNVLKRATK
ncbi:MAG: uroporphyrinogen-III C-methyltransferase [Deferribacterota bacterium]|nr:uroporphyrinogen-III C-methyltransferase [Deferribacterota bacterium]